MNDQPPVHQLAAMGDRQPDFTLARPLPASLLYRGVDPAHLPFELCSELEAAPGLIGQERAVEALDFAVRIRGKGYNVYALGAGGTGRHTMIEDLLRHKAEQDRPRPTVATSTISMTRPRRAACNCRRAAARPLRRR